MKISNMVSSNGYTVPNQFIIDNVMIDSHAPDGLCEYQLQGCVFQSYDSVICMRNEDGKIYLDTNTWNYSRTTAKYRNQFLGETTKGTQAKIDDGTYILTDLNG